MMEQYRTKAEKLFARQNFTTVLEMLDNMTVDDFARLAPNADNVGKKAVIRTLGVALHDSYCCAEEEKKEWRTTCLEGEKIRHIISKYGRDLLTSEIQKDMEDYSRTWAFERGLEVLEKQGYIKYVGVDFDTHEVIWSLAEQLPEEPVQGEWTKLFNRFKAILSKA